MKLLLTGADGFTGLHFTKTAVEAGYDVIPLQSDLLDSVAVKKEVLDVQPDLVVHLAAISFVAHGDAESIYKVNIVGTRNLLSALSLLDEMPKAVLLASSANVYGNTTFEVLNESTPISPANDYGVSKAAMEQMAQLWMDSLPMIIVRPFNYTGAGQDPKFLIPKIIDHFVRKESVIELGNIDVERDFSDVRVVSSAYQQLLNSSDAIGKTFNICSGVTHSLKDIISSMERIAGYRIEIRVNPKFVRPNEIKRLVGDNSYLHDVIGNQTYPEIEQTLHWMYSSALNANL